jgi:hypothetical protein
MCRHTHGRSVAHEYRPGIQHHGGSAIVAYFVWLLTTYRYPVDGRKILPLYLVAMGMQFIHLTEEYVADFPDDFSALTGSHLS